MNQTHPPSCSETIKEDRKAIISLSAIDSIIAVYQKQT